MVHPDDRAELSERARRAQQENSLYQYEYRVLPPDGGERWLAGYGRVMPAAPDAEGQPDRMVGVVMDITERKRQEVQLQELSLRLEQRNQVFNATLSHISDFAYVFDREGRFLYANQALLDLLELRSEEIVGKNFFDLQYPDELAARCNGRFNKSLRPGRE